MRGQVVAWAYRSGWRLVRMLPERAAYLLFSLVAQIAWLRQGRGVRQLESNLARVRPQASPAALRQLSRRAMHSYMRYWCDVFRLPDWTAERILATCRLENDAPMREALAGGQGVVLALAHQGNWDHAGAWSTLALAPVTTVAERLQPESLYEDFLEFRRRLGMKVLPLTGHRHVFAQLMTTLRSGGFVPLLADRDLTLNGVPVTMFGQPCRMAVGPAMLAVVSGAALFPVSILYERLPAAAPARWGTLVSIHPQVPVPEDGDRAAKVAAMTQACADALASGIARAPQDWHMLQKVFLSDLDTPHVPVVAETGG